jgi:hypothetical protein
MSPNVLPDNLLQVTRLRWGKLELVLPAKLPLSGWG